MKMPRQEWKCPGQNENAQAGFGLQMPHVLVKDGHVSLPEGFHSGLGIFILAWAQARMKLPRQGYMSQAGLYVHI